MRASRSAHAIWWLATALLLVASASPSIAQSQNSPAQNSPADRLWRHGITSPKADAGFYIMAARRGFAQREGIRLTLVNLKEDYAGVQALLAGEIESYEGSPNTVILAGARGADVRIVGCRWHAIPHGLFARLGINRPADLRGTTLATAPAGSLPDIMMRAILARAEVPPGEVKFAPIAGDRESYTALIGGVVDAAVVSNEYLPLPSSKGVKLIVDGRVALPNMVRSCIVTTARILAHREEDAVRFLTAEIKALRHGLANRDETVRLAFEASDMRADDPRPNFMFNQAIKPNTVMADLAIPLAKLEWMRDQLAQLNELDRPVDVVKLIEPSTRLKALERAR